MYFIFWIFSDNLLNSSRFCISLHSLLITCEKEYISPVLLSKRTKKARQISTMIFLS